MQTESSPSPKLEVPVFSQRAISVATGLGGPLAGSYLLFRNFNAFDRDGAARVSITLGIILTLVLVAGTAILLPDAANKTAYQVLPILLGGLGYFVVFKFQDTEIRAHFDAGGKRGGWPVVIVSVIASLAATLLLIFFLTIVSLGMADQAKLEAEAYYDHFFTGDSLVLEESGCRIYFDPAIKPANALVVGQQLQALGYFNSRFRVPAGLYLRENTFSIQVFLDKEKWDDPLVVHDCNLLLSLLREGSGGNPFEMVFISLDSTGRRESRTVTESQ